MKFAVFIPFLSFFPSAVDVNTPRESKPVTRPFANTAIRIVTWNIDHGARLAEVTKELRELNCDLCLLQEVDWNARRSANKDVAFQLGSDLNFNVAYGVEFEELSQEQKGAAYIGQATLSRLPLERSRVLRFSHQSSFWQPHFWMPSSLSIMQRRIGSRIALVTELEFQGKPLVVYNPHLESRSMGRIQMQQLNEILGDLKDHYAPDTNAIIAGDINSKYFPSIFLHKLQHAGFHSALGNRIERTHVIAMALDWIFVRGPFTLDDGSVERTAKGSDHYPIKARLGT